jgi:hypothetical protein
VQTASGQEKDFKNMLLESDDSDLGFSNVCRGSFESWLLVR